MKKAPFIFAVSFLLAFKVYAQDTLSINDLPFELPLSYSYSTLLFSGWVKATVTWYNPLIQNDTSLWFDYDKASQRLLVTMDKKTEFIFDRREIQSVTFHLGIYDFTFLHVPAINEKDLFYELVRSDRGYSLYKAIHLRMGKDGYLNLNEYYIVFPFPNARVLKLGAPDKRLLDRAFSLSSDKQKLDRYYTLHPDEEQGDHFLKGLIEFLNEYRPTEVKE